MVAVYRHQIDALADVATPSGSEVDPLAALRAWVFQFADFLITKHGLAEALRSDQAGFESLHGEFIDRLLPVCGSLVRKASEVGQIRGDIEPYDLLRSIGNLCIGVETDERYNARTMIDVLLTGLKLRRD